MVRDDQLAELAVLAEKRGLPLGTLAYERLVKGLRSRP